MSLALTQRPARRRIGLTPLIDVVVLLLIFFMLAASFSREVAVDLSGVAGAAGYDGPPRLVDVAPEGVRLNGVAVDEASLAEALAPLMAGPGDIVVVRPRDGADVQRLVDVLDALSRAGLQSLAVTP